MGAGDRRRKLSDLRRIGLAGDEIRRAGPRPYGYVETSYINHVCVASAAGKPGGVALVELPVWLATHAVSSEAPKPDVVQYAMLEDVLSVVVASTNSYVSDVHSVLARFPLAPETSTKLHKVPDGHPVAAGSVAGRVGAGGVTGGGVVPHVVPCWQNTA